MVVHNGDIDDVFLQYNLNAIHCVHKKGGGLQWVILPQATREFHHKEGFVHGPSLIPCQHLGNSPYEWPNYVPFVFLKTFQGNNTLSMIKNCAETALRLYKLNVVELTVYFVI